MCGWHGTWLSWGRKGGRAEYYLIFISSSSNGRAEGEDTACGLGVADRVDDLADLGSDARHLGLAELGARRRVARGDKRAVDGEDL